MVSLQIKEKMKEFLQTLPPRYPSLLLFDRANHIIGFAVFDRNDGMDQAHIFNLDCKEVFVVNRHTHLKDVIDRLLREQCVYTV